MNPHWKLPFQQFVQGCRPATAWAKQRHTAVALVGILSLTACSNDTTDPDRWTCDDPMSVSVAVDTSGSQPAFDWSPSCGVARVLVEQNAMDLWHIGSAPDENGIDPPVMYGVVPQGATEKYGPAHELVPGVTYDVFLWRLHTEQKRDILLANGKFTL